MSPARRLTPFPLERVRTADDAERAALELLHQVGILARRHGMSRLARETGLNRENLYKAFSGKSQTSLVTVAKVLRALGFRLALQGLPPEPPSADG